MAIAVRADDIDVDELVKSDRVHRLVYTDPAIFEAEMERIFERSWVFVAHESEIARSGDFKTTFIGRNPVIITRDSDAHIRVLMNRCMHRGAVVCREERGNTSAFRCGYHGWTYNTRGDLAIVTARGGYGPEFDQASLGLIPAPRLESYRGFYFASMNPTVEPLVDHLGKAKTYLDLALDASPEGEIEVSAGLSKYAAPANWKLQVENWIDHYHAPVTHEIAFATKTRRGERQAASLSRLEDGHRAEDIWDGVSTFGHGHGTTQKLYLAGQRNGPAAHGGAEYARALGRSYGSDRAREILNSDVQLVLFPNFFIQPNRHHFRVLRPVAVDRTEITAYPYTLKGAPDEMNRFQVQDLSWWASAAGFGQPDDVEAFARCQEGLQVRIAEWVLFMRGVHQEEVMPDGEIRGEGANEATQRGIYREWQRLMR